MYHKKYIAKQHLAMNLEIEKNVTLLNVSQLRDSQTSIGGRWKPDDCKPKFKTAIIVPISNDPTISNNYITAFLFHMHKFLRVQRLNYGIYFLSVDPSNEEQVFNKGILSNAGFKEALAEYGWNCFIFQDLEMLPLNEQNVYECNEDKPVRLASFSSFKNSKMYRSFVFYFY